MSDATSRPNLVRTRSLPNQQVHGFARPNPSDLSSDNDCFSDSSESLDGAGKVRSNGDEEGEEENGVGGDLYPMSSLLKLPSFFTTHNLLLVSTHDEAERQATQQQQQNYEAVMKRFQVRRVAVRAFSTSNVTAGAQYRSPMSSGHSSTPQGRRELEAPNADDLERGEGDRTPQQQNDFFGHPSTDNLDPKNTEKGGSFRSGGGQSRRSKSKGYAHSYPPEPQRSARFTLHRFLIKKKRRMLRRARRFATDLSSVIYPTSTFQRVRESVLFSIFVVQLACLPLLPIYFPQEEKLIMALQIVAEWVYFVDCALGFNTAYFKKTTNELVTARREIAKHYLCCGWFWSDLLSSVPINTVVYLASAGKGLFELNPQAYLMFDNVARIPRFVSFFRMIQALRAAARALRAGQNFWTWALLYSRYSHLLRVARLVFLVMLLEHYMACLWQYLSPDAATSANTSALELYIQNYYYVVLLVHGQSVETANIAQTVYSISAVFLGSFLVAIVFGNVAMLVSNFNSSATNYQRNMERVFATMKKLQLPNELQDRIHQFFTHLWQEYDAVDADLVKFQKELTPTLALEVGLCQYMNLITGVPYWKECSPDFVSQVIRNLVVRVYLPDDFVLRQREISQDLFMINRGTCERTHPLSETERDLDLRTMSSTFGSRQTNSPKPLHLPSKKNSKYHHSVRETADCPSQPYSPELLRPGQVFGGMGLLLNFEQQFNVRAVTHVEMCVLSRSEFQKILMRFQHDRPIVLAALLEHVILKNELPFSMEDVFGVSVLDEDEEASMEEKPARESDSLSSTARADLKAQGSPSFTKLTPLEAAHLLAKKINLQVVDPTIKFGFQQVDLPPESTETPDGVARPEKPPVVTLEQASTATVAHQPQLSARFSLLSPSAVVAPNELPGHVSPTQPVELLSGPSVPGNTESQSTSSLPVEGANEDSLSGLPEVGKRRKHSSGHHRHQSSKHDANSNSNEQLVVLQDEMQLLGHRVGEIEDSQLSVLNALEALQQSLARINLSVMALTIKPVVPGADRHESRALRQERSMHKILSLPAHWEKGGEGPPAAGENPREQTLSARPRSGIRLRQARALPRSQSGFQVNDVVPAQPGSVRTKRSVQPFRRRASMFPRRSANIANRPSISKKRELLADSLWTKYPSPQ